MFELPRDVIVFCRLDIITQAFRKTMARCDKKSPAFEAGHFLQTWQ
jgi:hypothetical protein